MAELRAEMMEIGRRARGAARRLARLSTAAKNGCLMAMAEAIEAASAAIAEANAQDLEAGRANALNAALLDRLALTPKRFAGVTQGLREVAALPDPVGGVDRAFTLENGLQATKVRVPIGVIGMIYESRPNVTADAGGLCFKAGNPVILRGGKEAIHSNRALAEAMRAGASAAGVDPNVIQLVPWTDREAVQLLLTMNEHVDLVIPRGGEGLIRYVVEHATVPVIKHYKGVCHTYIDRAADPAMALAIAVNAKCQRPGVCNAMETLLIHREVAPTIGVTVAEALTAAGVELRGDAAFCALVPTAKAATAADWDEEYLDLVLAVRVVGDLDVAMDHIAAHGSGHSDAIVTDDTAAAERFLREVDSAAVYVNASTRFTDGGQFGMGAEIGISTDRIHARGPMGLQELTTYKYVLRGHGQIRG